MLELNEPAPCHSTSLARRARDGPPRLLEPQECCSNPLGASNLSVSKGRLRGGVLPWSLVAQCSATPASVAATPPCSATPFQRRLDVRHSWRFKGNRCDRAFYRGCSVILLLHLKNPRTLREFAATRVARQGVPAHVCNYALELLRSFAPIRGDPSPLTAPVSSSIWCQLLLSEAQHD